MAGEWVALLKATASFIQETISAGAAKQISIREIHLSDGQARIVRQCVGEGVVPGITGHVSCTSAVGEFRRNLHTQTRAFIYRGAEAEGRQGSIDQSAGR